MSYSDFTLTSVKRAFGLIIAEDRDLFASVPPSPISEYLRFTLDEHLPLAQGSGSEKARSELLIAPLLVELRRLRDRQISLFSGTDLNVDPSRGLNGYCDFIISRSPEIYAVTAPALMIVEAKRENLVGGIGQCFASMVGAQEFNAREGVPEPIIYGAVTTGTAWKFLTLSGTDGVIDLPEYHISDVEKILGILQHIAA